MSVGERIRRELKRQERSISSFQDALNNRGTPGSSYASVHNYLNPEKDREPSLKFCRDAADELGVRFSWLVTGEGPRDDKEAKRRERLAAQRTAMVLPGIADSVETFVKDALGGSGVDLYDRLTIASRCRVLRTWQRLFDSLRWRVDAEEFLAGTLPKEPSKREAAMMQDVARVVAGVLQHVAGSASEVEPNRPWTVVTEPSGLPAYQLEDYVEGVCRALTALIAFPHQSESFEPLDLSSAVPSSWSDSAVRVVNRIPELDYSPDPFSMPFAPNTSHLCQSYEPMNPFTSRS